MKGMVTILLFTALVMICWGVYGPVLDQGKRELAKASVDSEPVDGFGNSLRAFICVGMAYFAIAVVVPIVLLKAPGEAGHWSTTGAVWSLIAGAAGALGALGVILALGGGGNPLYVMPLVFGCAPVVNTLTTMYMAKSFQQVSPAFLIGLALVILGSAAVLIFRPSLHGAPAGPIVVIDSGTGETEKYNSTSIADMKAKHRDIYDQYLAKTEKLSTTQVLVKVNKGDGKTIDYAAASTAEMKELQPEIYAKYISPILEEAEAKRKELAAKLPQPNIFLVALYTAMTAISWGVYGPTLHKGQAAMSGSRLRPLLCVGLAYMVIAVVIPSLIMFGRTNHGAFNATGTIWSLLGGATGAIGALGVIMAFNYGGKPIYVMPLVFGGAPVINTFVSLLGSNAHPSAMFYTGLLVAMAGAVTVLIFAPRPEKKLPPATDNPLATSAAH